MHLKAFLESRGFAMNPNGSEEYNGYMTHKQKEQFTKRLDQYPHIQKIAEIGFNGGHSAEHFFSRCKNLKLFAAFDLNCFACTSHAAEYFYEQYKGRFVFIPGDSLATLPELNEKYPQLKFDLIYIDGCHIFEWVLGDILNAKKIAHEKTLIWIDDLHMTGVAAAVKLAADWGYIKVEKLFRSNDADCGKREWAEAKMIL